MRRLKLIKTYTHRGIIYTVMDDDKVVYRSVNPTDIEYVAMLLNDKFKPKHRFRKANLVGRGDSRLDYFSHRYKYLAVTDKQRMNVFIPPKLPLYRYTFGLADTRMEIMEFSQEEAIKGFMKKCRVKGLKPKTVMVKSAKIVR